MTAFAAACAGATSAATRAILHVSAPCGQAAAAAAGVTAAGVTAAAAAATETGTTATAAAEAGVTATAALPHAAGQCHLKIGYF